MREHRIDVGGRTLCVVQAGDPEGRTIFSLHGTPGSRGPWREVVEDAERRGIRLIAYDRPGYGHSDPAPGRTVADAAGDIAAIADALGVERYAVYGGSGGGPHALANAVRSDRVVAVAALASVAPWGAEGLDWLDGMGQDNLDEFAATLAGEEELREYLAKQRDSMLSASPEGIADSLESLLCPPDRACLTGELATYFYDQVREALRDGVEGWVQDDIVFVMPWGFELADISVPVQVWHGAQDQFVPVAHGRWLAERIPDAEEHVYAEDGHLTLQIARVGDVHDWLLRHF
jgi:pimeloyl-ACP methyl ester carboxylesterase